MKNQVFYILKKVLKFLNWLLVGSFIYNCAEMYGSPTSFDYDISIRTLNNKNQPIPDLKVSLYNECDFVNLTNNSLSNNYLNFSNSNTINAFIEKITLSNGVAEFKFSSYYYKFVVVIKDIDGISNLGEFETTNFIFKKYIDNNIDVVNIDVVMEEKK